MKRLNAFEHYLLSIEREQAIVHILDCLREGEPSNAAWELLERFNGPNWSVKPEGIISFIDNTLSSLQDEARP